MSLSAAGIRQVLGRRSVLDGVDLELETGTVTLLAGRNGAGKSTLMGVLSGIRHPDAGEVRLLDAPLADLTPRERARRIALVPQAADSPFEFTGRELATMGRHPHVPRFSSPTEADRRAVDEALESVDAVAFADRPVTTLSGGELRRIAIARALATDAPVLLADEPTANLDLEHALAILKLFADLASAGRTVLLASHDLNLIAPRVHNAALLFEGRIVRSGPPQEALSAEWIERVFAVRPLDPQGYFPRAFEPFS